MKGAKGVTDASRTEGSSRVSKTHLPSQRSTLCFAQHRFDQAGPFVSPPQRPSCAECCHIPQSEQRQTEVQTNLKGPIRSQTFRSVFFWNDAWKQYFLCVVFRGTLPRSSPVRNKLCKKSSSWDSLGAVLLSCGNLRQIGVAKEQPSFFQGRSTRCKQHAANDPQPWKKNPLTRKAACLRLLRISVRTAGDGCLAGAFGAGIHAHTLNRAQKKTEKKTEIELNGSAASRIWYSVSHTAIGEDLKLSCHFVAWVCSTLARYENETASNVCSGRRMPTDRKRSFVSSRFPIRS